MPPQEGRGWRGEEEREEEEGGGGQALFYLEEYTLVISDVQYQS